MQRFAAPDGSTLVYDAYEPDGGTRAALLVTHGWGEHGGRYRWLGEQLRHEGIAVYAADVRGHGRSAGRRGHLSRFSQLLGDLQAFCRAVHARRAAPQVLFGHGFGALVVLRYLETDPAHPPRAAVISAPLLAPAQPAPAWQRAVQRLLADVWPTLALSLPVDAEHLSRDPAAGAAYRADPAVHRVATLWARREIAWAQRAVVADAGRLGVPLLFLLAGEDHVVDAQAARAFAAAIHGETTVRWYGEMYHELLHDPQRAQVRADLLAFLSEVTGRAPVVADG